MEYDSSTLLRVRPWQLIQNSMTRTDEQKSIRPGEEYVERRILRISNTDKPVNTLQDYKRRMERHRKSKNTFLFEKYLPDLSLMLEQMLKDDLKKRGSKTQVKEIITPQDLEVDVLALEPSTPEFEGITFPTWEEGFGDPTELEEGIE